MVRTFAPLALLLLLAPPAVGSAPAILVVSPAAADSLLVCGVATRGLPGGSSVETLRSGLPSALVFGFSLLDASGRTVGGSRAEVRIEPDLWEDLFLVKTPMYSTRLRSVDDVRGFLGNLGGLPVLPLERLARDASYRLRVRLAVYALAPSEVRRSRDRLTGGGELRDPDRREVSVGLNSLLKFFLGKEDEEPWEAEALSPLFRRRDLPRFEEPPAAPRPEKPALDSEGP